MIKNKRNFKLLITYLTLFCFFSATLVSTNSKASFMESQMVTKNGEAVSLRDIDEIKVKRVLEHKLVSEKLRANGLTEEQVLEKIDKMSDEEVHQIASLSDKIPAGGDSATGVIITILVIVALVLLILYLWKRV